MVCKACNEAGILNHANGHSFYYCRTCKIEIFLEEVVTKQPEVPLTQFEVDEMLEYWQEINKGVL